MVPAPDPGKPAARPGHKAHGPSSVVSRSKRRAAKQRRPPGETHETIRQTQPYQGAYPGRPRRGPGQHLRLPGSRPGPWPRPPGHLGGALGVPPYPGSAGLLGVTRDAPRTDSHSRGSLHLRHPQARLRRAAPRASGGTHEAGSGRDAPATSPSGCPAIRHTPVAGPTSGIVAPHSGYKAPGKRGTDRVQYQAQQEVAD